MELDYKMGNMSNVQTALMILKARVGLKNYYVSISGGMMTSFMLGLMVSPIWLKVLFIINAIGLFLVVVYD